MTQEEKITKEQRYSAMKKICKRIQKDLDKLYALGYSVTDRYSVKTVFDNKDRTIEYPEGTPVNSFM